MRRATTTESETHVVLFMADFSDAGSTPAASTISFMFHFSAAVGYAAVIP
jgi:hypothetical protein